MLNTGDSGGGFVVNESGIWFLKGIVSASLRDSVTNSCDLKNNIVLTDVAKYLDWIRISIE